MNFMHKAGALLLTTLTLLACGAMPGKISVDKPVPRWDSPHEWALDGYDPVAYFTDHQPVAGKPEYSYRHDSVQWKFASREHQQLFAATPERYAPQYGGYCAYAVSRGTTAHGDPQQWAIVNDKLYVNNNAFAMQLWNQDRPDNIDAGDINWPLIPKQPALAD